MPSLFHASDSSNRTPSDAESRFTSPAMPSSFTGPSEAPKRLWL
jgi:hypothetical protein